MGTFRHLLARMRKWRKPLFLPCFIGFSGVLKKCVCSFRSTIHHMESGFSENDSRPLSPDSTKKYLAGCLPFRLGLIAFPNCAAHDRRRLDHVKQFADLLRRLGKWLAAGREAEHGPGIIQCSAEIDSNSTNLSAIHLSARSEADGKQFAVERRPRARSKGTQTVVGHLQSKQHRAQRAGDDPHA